MSLFFVASLALASSYSLNFNKRSKEACVSSSECYNPTKACVNGICTKIINEQHHDCRDNGCVKGYCCTLNVEGHPICAKKSRIHFSAGDSCVREGCSACGCGSNAGLTCRTQVFLPPPLRQPLSCQEVRRSSPLMECASNAPCPVDHCCVDSGYCKPVRKLGERCYPPGYDESHLDCLKFCEDGTSCLSGPEDLPGYYTCQKDPKAKTRCK